MGRQRELKTLLQNMHRGKGKKVVRYRGYFQREAGGGAVSKRKGEGDLRQPSSRAGLNILANQLDKMGVSKRGGHGRGMEGGVFLRGGGGGEPREPSEG